MDTQSYAYTKIHLTIYFTQVTCVNLNKAVKNIHRNQQSSYANNQLE